MNHKKGILVIGTSVRARDVPPLLALVTGLIERGNDVLFIGVQRLIELTRGVGLSIQPLPPELEMFSYLDRWRRSVRKSQESRLFLLDWGDAVFDICVATLSDFRPDVAVCSLLTTLYLGTIVREKLGTALCCLNGSYYFGPGSRALSIRISLSQAIRSSRKQLRCSGKLISQFMEQMHSSIRRLI